MLMIPKTEPRVAEQGPRPDDVFVQMAVAIMQQLGRFEEKLLEHSEEKPLEGYNEPKRPITHRGINDAEGLAFGQKLGDK